jgi:Glu-tRNA(Gln) amidotransferase subunit E-like FAD-binding protein
MRNRMEFEEKPWFRKDWIGSNAKALGVYMALLLVRFRVRLRTDIPNLYSDEGIIEQRLEPYLSIFLRDEDKKLIEAIDAGKEFFKALVEHTSYNEYESVLDRIETNFYDIFKVAYLEYVNKKEIAGKISDYDTTALTRTFLSDVSANRFSKGKITHAGSSILLTPFSELMEFYGLSEEDVRRFMEILRMGGIMFFDIVPAPVLEKEFMGSLSP